MPFTVAYRNTLLDTITSPIYVQIHTGDPTDAGTSNVSTVGSRVSVTLGSASSGSRSNNSSASWTNIDITPSTETITHFSIWSASTSGTCIGYGSLTSSRTVQDGDTITVSNSNITISLS